MAENYVVELDTVELEDSKFQKFLNDHNIVAILVNENSNCAQVEYYGSMASLKKMIAIHFGDPDLEQFIEVARKY